MDFWLGSRKLAGNELTQALVFFKSTGLQKPLIHCFEDIVPDINETYKWTHIRSSLKPAGKRDG